MKFVARLRPSIAALLCAGAAMSAQANLISNGTFDSQPNGSDWSLSNSCVGGHYNYMWTTFNSGVGHGNYIRLNECGNAGSNPTASQTVSGLTVGARYEVKWDLMLYEYGNNFGTGKSFGLFLGSDATGQQLLVTELASLYGWQTFTASFIANSSTQTLTFAGELDARTTGGPGLVTDVAYGIDNVSLDQVRTLPEPASLALAALAVVGAFIARRTGRTSRQG